MKLAKVYDDSPVVFCNDYFPSYETHPPEADYIDLFKSLSFPILPLEFIKFCEDKKRGIHLPPALVARVKEIEGGSALPEAANVIQEDTYQNDSLSRRDKQWKYLENEIKNRKWNPMEIPWGGKISLRNYCVNNMRKLFLSEDAFDKFWQDMRRLNRIDN